MSSNGRLSVFFFNDTATTEIYTLSLPDALPISVHLADELEVYFNEVAHGRPVGFVASSKWKPLTDIYERSEEHTSELQSQSNLVCRLLLEKKKDYETTLVLLI